MNLVAKLIPQHDPALRPKVGVGVILYNGSEVLMGHRIGAHGNETWGFPGGHLEFGESPFDCARREVAEETGLVVNELMLGQYTNDIFEAERKHYITLFVLARYEGGIPKIMQPETFLEWRWSKWSEMPEPLFLPIRNLISQGFSL